MRFQCAKMPGQDAVRPRVNPIQGVLEILPMIDASSPNAPRRASSCQMIMGHRVGPTRERARKGTGTGVSCSLRTSGIATFSINHRAMTGTCSVSHEFDSSNLHFDGQCWVRILLSVSGTISGLPLIGRRYRRGVSHGMRRRGAVEN